MTKIKLFFFLKLVAWTDIESFDFDVGFETPSKLGNAFDTFVKFVSIPSFHLSTQISHCLNIKRNLQMKFLIPNVSERVFSSL